MCGRLAQHRAAEKYLAQLSLDAVVAGRDRLEAINRYNVAPSTRVDLLRAVDEEYLWSPVRWGWEPAWSSRPMRNTINATREKVSTSAYYRAVWPNRALIAADGWYEWYSAPGEQKKQPFYIRRNDDEPLFIPAIGQFSRLNVEPRQGDGFRIITADSQGGMLDVHDRRPVVFSPETALEWLSPILSDRARELLFDSALHEDTFTWFAVNHAVGNTRNEGSHLIQPI